MSPVKLSPAKYLYHIYINITFLCTLIHLHRFITLKIVIKPSKKVTPLQLDYAAMHIIRYMNAQNEGVPLADILRLFRLSPYLKEIKRLVSVFAYENEERWYLRDFLRDKKISPEEAKMLDKKYNLEELQRSFTPEQSNISAIANLLSLSFALNFR